MSRERVPQYLKHKRSGRAFVVVRDASGRRRQVTLGVHGTPESRRRYREVVAAYLTGELDLGGDKPHPSDCDEAPLEVQELVARFLLFAQDYYPQPRKGKGELASYIYASGPLVKLFGDVPVSAFGPLKLKRVRELMIEKCWSRRVINQQVGRIKRVFKFGVENELVPPAVLQGLQAVRGLARGRTTARETEPIEPVPRADVDAMLPYCSRQVRAMVELQWFSGMRPSEVARMRMADIDTSGAVWVYAPAEHKTAWRGRKREIDLGPRAQDILKPFLRADPQAHLFQPEEAMREHRARLRAARKSKVPPSQIDRSRPNPEKKPGPFFDVDAYRRCIANACRKAGIDSFGPNRLRHSRATEVRRLYGLEGAQVTLGHASCDVTQVYAERDRALARRIALETG